MEKAAVLPLAGSTETTMIASVRLPGWAGRKSEPSRRTVNRPSVPRSGSVPGGVAVGEGSGSSEGAGVGSGGSGGAVSPDARTRGVGSISSGVSSGSHRHRRVPGEAPGDHRSQADDRRPRPPTMPPTARARLAGRIARHVLPRLLMAPDRSTGHRTALPDEGTGSGHLRSAPRR